MPTNFDHDKTAIHSPNLPFDGLHPRTSYNYMDYRHQRDGSLVGRPIADNLPTIMHRSSYKNSAKIWQLYKPLAEDVFQNRSRHPRWQQMRQIGSEQSRVKLRTRPTFVLGRRSSQGAAPKRDLRSSRQKFKKVKHPSLI